MLSECAGKGSIPTQKDVAKLVPCSVEAVSLWNRNPEFRRAAGAVIDECNKLELRLLHRAVIRRGMSGSVKHAELAFQVGGLLEVSAPPGEGGGVHAPGSVVFVGIPRPPTPQEAERLRPPIGSNVIIPAPQLPPAGGPK